jgi:lipopolysaccharide/colanic/teichoic acid biosynthesis glycosyltransferase
MNGVVLMYEAFFKRTLDILVSSSLIVLAMPLFMILFFLVRADSKGPFLLVQPRVGRNLKIFNIYKIRTMDAQSSLKSLDTSRKYITTSAKDPRITRVGHTIRKLHIDELPQLLNVLKGEMSLVGVRPDALFQATDYTTSISKSRHLRGPRITGLAAINAAAYEFIRVRNNYDVLYSRKKPTPDLDNIPRTSLDLFRS